VPFEVNPLFKVKFEHKVPFYFLLLTAVTPKQLTNRIMYSKSEKLTSISTSHSKEHRFLSGEKSTEFSRVRVRRDFVKCMCVENDSSSSNRHVVLEFTPKSRNARKYLL
jgi:hypothetical protein